MMSASGTPCFKAGPKVLNNLRKRFNLGKTEEQCVEIMLSMISDSIDAWCTRQYDFYQRVLNGIL
jgi:phosphatidylinositol 4-kinase